MNSEAVQAMMLVSGALLWSIGGMRWKWARRYLLPALLALVGWLTAQSALAPWLAACGMLAVVACLPYGERTRWWFRCLVGLCFGLPTMSLGFHAVQAIPAVVFIGTYVMARTVNLKWRICEALTGAAVVAPFVQFMG